MGTYEVLFILPSRLGEDEVTSTIEEFKGVAKEGGLSLLSEDFWGKRRLAYPIQKAQDGFYHLFQFEGDGTGLPELDRKMKNSDRIMRHMIVRTDLEMMRAKKLAIKNPPKTRVRPTQEGARMSAPASTPAPAEASAPPEVAPSAPVQEAPAVPEAPEVKAAPVEAGEAEIGGTES